MKNHYRNRCTVNNQNELKIENILDTDTDTDH